MTADAHLPPAAHLLALATLPRMGPARLLALSLLTSPAEAWAHARAGTLERLLGPARLVGEQEPPGPRWRSAARSTDVAALWAAHRGVGVAARGDVGYPAVLSSDLEPPAVICWLGDPDRLRGPRVGVVGSRRPSRTGLAVAHEVGQGLAAAGVTVVSGLAMGIDAAAHRGALAAAAGAAGGVAPPVGVVASGLDRPYPRSSADLWAAVAERGLLLSEAPLGTRPEAWRFPARNRIIAALSDVLVVVESGDRGGSMYTVDEALRRDRSVLAVPGSVGSPAAAGTNRLLVEGATPVRDSTDVLAVLGLTPARPPAQASLLSGPAPAPEPPRTPLAREVLRLVAGSGAMVDDLVAATGRSLTDVALVVEELVASGALAWVGGRVEAVPPRAGR